MTSPPIPADRSALHRLVASSRLLRGLDADLVAGLVPHASLHRLTHGECFWRRGARAEHFHVVQRGVLELQRAASSADSTLIALFGPGESPGVPVTIERGTFIADAFAATPTLEVLRIRAAPILDAAQRDPALANALSRALLAHCQLLHAKIDVLASGNMPRRLAALLLDLADRFGDEGLDGRTYVPLVLSRAQLATYIGARVETVIRICSQWHKDGLVEKTRDGFVIRSIEELRAVLTGEGRDETVVTA